MTTVFTCANETYQDFVPLFIHSHLYHNKDVEVEVGVERMTNHLIKALEKIEGQFLVRLVSFEPRELDGVTFKVYPQAVRMIETPHTENEYVYISDVDIINLDPLVKIHLNNMKKTGLQYSNVVRTDYPNKRLTALHFTKWDLHYPIENYLDIASLLHFDDGSENFLYAWVKKQGLRIDEDQTYRPVHGIHVSPNREIEGKENNWGCDGWGSRWKRYRNSDSFKKLEPYLSIRVADCIKQIDNYYKEGRL